jgi:hypothetical protein
MTDAHESYEFTNQFWNYCCQTFGTKQPKTRQIRAFGLHFYSSYVYMHCIIMYCYHLFVYSTKNQ